MYEALYNAFCKNRQVRSNDNGLLLYVAKLWLKVLFMQTCFDIRRQTRTTHLNWAKVHSDLKKFPHTQFFFSMNQQI